MTRDKIMGELLDHLWGVAEERSRAYPDEEFRLRGLWDLDIRFQPTPEERLFKYTTAIAQTRGQGCCYAPPDYSVSFDPELFRKDARDIEFTDQFIEIAVLDAIYASFDYSAAKTYELRGDPTEKSRQRTDILLQEIQKSVEGIEDPSLLNIGVLGNVISELAATDITTYATDMDPEILGTEVHGVTIEEPTKNGDRLANVDTALVTGMTLATESLGAIIERANKYDTDLILFAETGSNFAKEYCSLGVDVVVREPFPFYIFQGVSEIEVLYPEVGQEKKEWQRISQ